MKRYFKLIPLVLFILSMIYTIIYSYQNDYNRATYFLGLAILNAITIIGMK